MAVKRAKETSQPLILVLGLLIVIGAVFTYFYILHGVFGRFEASDLVPDTKNVGNYLFGKAPRTAILNSQYTRNILPPGSKWIEENISTWGKFLDLMNIEYDVLTDREIEIGNSLDYDLIILPGSKALSDIEIARLKKFLDNGGSVFATSGTASFSNDGKWRGWEFLSEVFGIKFTKEMTGRDNAKVHTLRGGLPITANIPTGYPLKVATWDVPMAVEVLDPRTEQVSFWFNYRLEEGLIREEIKKSAGITYGTYGKGKFIWMGFEINSIAGIQDDYIYFERLIRNSLSWLRGKPLAYLKEWPGSYSAAAVILPVISESPSNINSLLDLLSNEKVEADFLIDTETARENHQLIKRLSRFGNITAVADVGYITSLHDSINTLKEYDIQLNEFLKTKEALENISDKPVKGVKPYYGLYDHNSLKAAIEAGYKYIITDSMTDRSVPRNLIMEKGSLVILTKTTRDDYEVVRDFNLTDPSFQFYTYQEDIDRVLFEGSLYIFQPHTDYQLKPEYMEVVKDVIKDLKQKNFWITTSEKISDWYSQKNYIELRADQRGPGRISIRVSNPGNQLIEQVVVSLEMSGPAENISVTTEIIGVKPATFIYKNGENVLYLVVKDLKKGESRTYYLDYSKPNA